MSLDSTPGREVEKLLAMLPVYVSALAIGCLPMPLAATFSDTVAVLVALLAV